MLKHCHATLLEQQNRRGGSRRSLNFDNNSSLNSSTRSSPLGNFGGGGLRSTPPGSGSSSTRNSPLSDTTSTSSSFVLLNNTSPGALNLNSRTSSYASLNLTADSSFDLNHHGSGSGGLSAGSVPRTVIKIYIAKGLKMEVEYKTLSISRNTTSAEVIWMLLSKFKMRHRDPKLFFLTMEIGLPGQIPESNKTITLDEDARPAELQSCHPWGECKFMLQMKKGGLVRIHNSVLMRGSQYKCLLISEHTSVREVVTILFHCYGLERIEQADRYVLWEVETENSLNQRPLHPDDCPAAIQMNWSNPGQFNWILKRSNSFSSASLSRPVRPIQPIYARPAEINRLKQSQQQQHQLNLSPASSSNSSELSSEESMDTSYSTTSTTNSDHSTSPSPELLSRPKFNINEPVSSYSASSNSAISTTPVSARFSSLQSHSSSGLVNVPRLASIQETSRVMESIEQKSAISAVSANQRSIHESGLPVIGPKPIQTPPPSLLLANGSRGSITSFSNIANLRVTFHDYENYFYI